MNMKYWGHCLLFMLGLASVCSCTDSEKIVHYRGIAVDDANGYGAQNETYIED